MSEAPSTPTVAPGNGSEKRSLLPQLRSRWWTLLLILSVLLALAMGGLGRVLGDRRLGFVCAALAWLLPALVAVHVAGAHLNLVPAHARCQSLQGAGITNTIRAGKRRRRSPQGRTYSLPVTSKDWG